MDKIRIGLIGCGKQASKHIAGLRKSSDTEIILADIEPVLAQDLASKEGVTYVDAVDKIFADPTISAVDICTPTNSHMDLVRWAMASGKNFFSEKPLCEDISEARELQTLIEQNPVIGMVGYIYRFAPAFELGHRLFQDVPRSGDSQVLGKVVSAFFRLGGRGGHQLWKHKKDTGGGAINEMLVHMIDLAIWYFGPVQEAEMLACELLRPKRVIQGKEEVIDAEDYVLARLIMESGVEVLCQADLVTPAFTQFIEVQGENGTFMGSIMSEWPCFTYCIRDAAGYPAGRTDFNFGYHNLFEAQMAEYLRSIRFGQQPGRCTIKDSLLVLDALEKLRKGYPYEKN